MALRKGSVEIKNRILSVCVRLFIEQGYNQTPISQIIKEADVSASSFQNFFHTKDGVLSELIKTMFSGQFGVARSIIGEKLTPVYVYAVETSIQLVLTEMNENLRDIYIEAYSQRDTSEYIYQHTAIELYHIFGMYFPDFSESDFYELEIGTSGIMRSYMAKPCDIHFPLERKIERFLSISMRAYKVPENEQEKVIDYIKSLDIRKIADSVMQKLFAMLEMKFDFTLTNSRTEVQ